MTVKKLITGNAKATKEEIPVGLKKYIGDWNYSCDDESDAMAVAVAWLLKHGFL